MDDIEKLLAEIKQEYQGQTGGQSKQLITTQPVNISTTTGDVLVDSLLASVKADFAALDAAEELKKQAELEQERKRQAQIKAKELEKLQKQAQQWLSKLDPLSSEGLWFERFAENYPSKLAAAIEYLQINQ
ncbi:hypothetical protein B6N60_04115 [Richelia sinica FACHB-800]|uniref:Uncharacterized protein n=1 Tax=Richelia sinica FACHB-800 TaxID=1357546 RepID=A0A975TBG8_9NOST|nr:hypothetical protein [Richelia sinica]MBD2664842.1 hypothetical protein [Richelia sinica FACHB-800]QXE25400.1 hypothetical protein B6N60_04115 [Richelia sinica FACHB-800]